MRKPDFERNTLKILKGQLPERPALFELFLNQDYYERLAGRRDEVHTPVSNIKLVADALAAAGYDYATAQASGFSFPRNDIPREKTISMNDFSLIRDRASYEAVKWQDPDGFSMDEFEQVAPLLPEGMKLMIMGPCGILENMEMMVGYDRLCMMLFDDPDLVKEIADRIGGALLRYYERALEYDSVGFICYNDDWGFNTQTLISPADLRRLIFPWCKKIVAAAHRHGKPCILHSCGYFFDIMDDIIDDMKFDARHSYEDSICPVEQAYDKYHDRITILGGIDMDFMVRKTPADIFKRATDMLERSCGKGRYMLGTGNSVPEYVPFDNYMALVRAAEEFS